MQCFDVPDGKHSVIRFSGSSVSHDAQSIDYDEAIGITLASLHTQGMFGTSATSWQFRVRSIGCDINVKMECRDWMFGIPMIRRGGASSFQQLLHLSSQFIFPKVLAHLCSEVVIHGRDVVIGDLRISRRGIARSVWVPFCPKSITWQEYSRCTMNNGGYDIHAIPSAKGKECYFNGIPLGNENAILLNQFLGALRAVVSESVSASPRMNG